MTIYVNGIDGTTGEYLVPPLERSELIERINEMAVQPWLKQIASAAGDVRGLPYDRDPAIVEQAGWGVVVHEREDPAVVQALESLIAHRPNAKHLVYKTGESRSQFLGRYRVAPPNVDPEKVPYYLLIIGSPSSIPFQFSNQLSVDYAVGRLDFEKPEQYRAYAESVVAYETAARVENDKRVVVFGPRHDPATRLSADKLLTPIAEAKYAGYTVTPCIGDGATKTELRKLLGSRPSLLFTASHGVGWPSGHPQQEALQGALRCQDDFFAARDVDATANVGGLIAFHFACFSAGTPATDRFPINRNRVPAIAPRPFTAALPKAMLSHPQGSALACVGHVERAWGYSIESDDAGPQLRAFENFIGRVLQGAPVGFAMRDFREKYAVLSVEVSNLLEQRESQNIDDDELAMKWVERNDAEAYLVLGDPAVHIRTGGNDA